MKTLINIKADKEVKETAQKLAKELGLPLSSVINAYLKEFIRERSLHLSIEPLLRPEVGESLKKASADYRHKRNISRPLKNLSEVREYLRS